MFWRDNWTGETAAILEKELRCEWRTRVALSGIGLFALVTLTLIGLAFRGASALPTESLPGVAAALLWLLLLFTAATGLGRSFVQEEERGTATALRLTARGTAVWTGKFAANTLLLLLITGFATPLLLAILAVPLSGANLMALICVLGLGALGLSAVFTMTAALVAQAANRGGLLAALAFPLTAPLLQAGVHGTQAAIGVGGADFRGDVQILLSFAVIAITASLLLFDSIWND